MLAFADPGSKKCVIGGGKRSATGLCGLLGTDGSRFRGQAADAVRFLVHKPAGLNRLGYQAPGKRVGRGIRSGMVGDEDVCLYIVGYLYAAMFLGRVSIPCARLPRRGEHALMREMICIRDGTRWESQNLVPPKMPSPEGSPSVSCAADMAECDLGASRALAYTPGQVIRRPLKVGNRKYGQKNQNKKEG